MQERSGVYGLIAMIEAWMHNFAHLGIVVLEAIGVAVIVFAGVRGIIEYVRKKPRAQGNYRKSIQSGYQGRPL